MIVETVLSAVAVICALVVWWNVPMIMPMFRLKSKIQAVERRIQLARDKDFYWEKVLAEAHLNDLLWIWYTRGGE